MPRIVIHGRPGCGKTLTAPKLQQHYGCPTLVDEWDGHTPLPEGALALTGVEPPFCAAADRVIEYTDALEEICETLRRTS